jgi:transposase
VGGLKRSQCADLYDISKDSFVSLDGERFKESCAFRTACNVYNRGMTILIVYNQNLYDGQMQGIANNIEKTADKLTDLQKRLRDRADGLITKGRTPTSASIEKQLKTILSTEFMHEIFVYNMTTMENLPYFTYSFSLANLEHLQNTILGKTVLFTNRHDWTNEEIVASYRSAWHVEHAFRQMKDKDHLTVRPLFHWTDEKIKVHIFYCVLAYRLCCILMKELLSKGVSGSCNHILNQLNDIKHVTTVLGTSRSDILCSFSRGTNLAESISDLYDLKNKYLPDIY